MKFNKILKRYRNALICCCILVIIFSINKEIGTVAIKGTLDNIWELIKLVPPVFVLLGLMDVWVQKEKMVKLMGDGAGLKGIIIAFIFGSFAAGPLYAAFPIGAMLLRKGSSIKNVMIFIGAWACTKVPMLIIEVSSLGLEFTIIRMTVEIVGIIIIAYLIERLLNQEDKLFIYKNAEKI